MRCDEVKLMTGSRAKKMKPVIIENPKPDRLKNYLPEGYHDIVPPSIITEETTLYIFPHDPDGGHDVVKTGNAKSILKKINPARKNIVVAANFTDEAICLFEANDVLICARSKFHWTEDREAN